MEYATSNRISLEGKPLLHVLSIAQALILSMIYICIPDLQKELNSDIAEYYLLIAFLTFYGKKEKGQPFLSVGAQASEKTSLFFERDLWQRLLLQINEKDNLPQFQVKKLTTLDVLELQ